MRKVSAFRGYSNKFRQFRANSFKIAMHPRMHGLQFRSSDQPLGHAMLVADYDDEVPSFVEEPNRLAGSGQKSICSQRVTF
jgi:hypothetical protein